MKYAIIFDTDFFCGDHSQDRTVAIKVVENETVEQLINRISKTVKDVQTCDDIIIKIIKD